MESTGTALGGTAIERMFQAGAHFGFGRSRRHPSVASYLFGLKNKVEIFDLEKTAALLEEAKRFVEGLGREGKQVLFVASKREAKDALLNAAERAEAPFSVGRWIGGTLTNFEEIRKRVARLETLRDEREKGELSKYTKKERLLFDREIEALEESFGGIVSMRELPAALFVVDAKHESTAVNEAKKTGIPVVALCSSDCNIANVSYPITANDSARASITLFVDEIAQAYREGKNAHVATPAQTAPTQEESAAEAP